MKPQPTFFGGMDSLEGKVSSADRLVDPLVLPPVHVVAPLVIGARVLSGVGEGWRASAAGGAALR